MHSTLENPAATHRSEGRHVLRLGAPIIATQLLQMTVGVADTVMAGRYAATDLAGVALAGAVFFPSLLLIFGTMSGITPIVAQLYGGGRVAETGGLARQGFIVALITGAVTALFLSQGHYFIGLLATEDNGASLEVAHGYLDAVVWGMPGLALYGVLRGFCEGLGRTRPAMVVAAVMVVFNLFLNYAFIFGRFGFPELGGVGCGVATAIVFWLEGFGMLLIVVGRRYRETVLFVWRASAWRPQFSQMRRILKIGLPSAITMAPVSVATSIIAAGFHRVRA